MMTVGGAVSVGPAVIEPGADVTTGADVITGADVNDGADVGATTSVPFDGVVATTVGKLAEAAVSVPLAVGSVVGPRMEVPVGEVTLAGTEVSVGGRMLLAVADAVPFAVPVGASVGMVVTGSVAVLKAEPELVVRGGEITSVELPLVGRTVGVVSGPVPVTRPVPEGVRVLDAKLLSVGVRVTGTEPVDDRVDASLGEGSKMLDRILPRPVEPEVVVGTEASDEVGTTAPVVAGPVTPDVLVGETSLEETVGKRSVTLATSDERRSDVPGAEVVAASESLVAAAAEVAGSVDVEVPEVDVGVESLVACENRLLRNGIRPGESEEVGAEVEAADPAVSELVTPSEDASEAVAALSSLELDDTPPGPKVIPPVVEGAAVSWDTLEDAADVVGRTMIEGRSPVDPMSESRRSESDGVLSRLVGVGADVVLASVDGTVLVG